VAPLTLLAGLQPRQQSIDRRTHRLARLPAAQTRRAGSENQQHIDWLSTNGVLAQRFAADTLDEISIDRSLEAFLRRRYC
jgi:hypothetical protein